MRGQLLKNKIVYYNDRQSYIAYCGNGFTGFSVGVAEKDEISSIISKEDANNKAFTLAVFRANSTLLCVPSFGYSAYYNENYVCVEINVP